MKDAIASTSGTFLLPITWFMSACSSGDTVAAMRFSRHSSTFSSTDSARIVNCSSIFCSWPLGPDLRRAEMRASTNSAVPTAFNSTRWKLLSNSIECNKVRRSAELRISSAACGCLPLLPAPVVVGTKASFCTTTIMPCPACCGSCLSRSSEPSIESNSPLPLAPAYDSKLELSEPNAPSSELSRRLSLLGERSPSVPSALDERSLSSVSNNDGEDDEAAAESVPLDEAESRGSGTSVRIRSKISSTLMPICQRSCGIT